MSKSWLQQTMDSADCLLQTPDVGCVEQPHGNGAAAESLSQGQDDNLDLDKTFGISAAMQGVDDVYTRLPFGQGVWGPGKSLSSTGKGAGMPGDERVRGKGSIAESNSAAFKSVANLANAATQITDAVGNLQTNGFNQGEMEAGKQMMRISRGFTQIAKEMDGYCSVEKPGAPSNLQALDDYQFAIMMTMDVCILIDRATEAKRLQDTLDHLNDYDGAKAWAAETAGLFAKADNILSNIYVAPPFIKKYFSGLMKAPLNYVNAFISIMDAYRHELDAVSPGGGNDTYFEGNSDWVGEHAGLYSNAYTIRNLNAFLDNHRHIGGVDITAMPVSDLSRVMIGELYDAREDGSAPGLDIDQAIAFFERRT